MQVRTVWLSAGVLALTLAAAASAQEPAATAEPAQPAAGAKPAPAAKPAPKAEPPVDENGVPAWAKRRRLQPVQNCEGKPGINSATWRERVDSSGGPERPKIRPPQATCR